MRILGTAVLSMESLVVGLALLLAMDNHSGAAIWGGAALALAILLTTGLMKRRLGWYLGSILQVALIAYGAIVTTMYALGTLFAGIWIAAYFVGKRGEAIRAALLAERAKQSGNS